MTPRNVQRKGFIGMVEDAFLYALQPKHLMVIFTYNFISLSLILYFVLRLLWVYRTSFLMGVAENELMKMLAVVFSYLIFAGIVIDITGLVVKGAFFRNAHSWQRKRKENMLEDFIYSARRLPGMILLGLVLFIFHSFGYVFTLAGAEILDNLYSIVLSIVFWFALPFLIIKKQSAVASIQNSWKIFRKKYADMAVYWIAGSFINLILSFLFLAPLVLVILKMLFGTANIFELSAQMNLFLSSPGSVQTLIISLPEKIYAYRISLFLTYLLNIAGMSITALFWYAYTVAVFRRIARA